jgi:long-chain acyl-CoA synthetase
MGCSHSRQRNAAFVYSVPVTPIESANGESQVYRNADSKDQLYSTMIDEPNIKTVQHVYLRSFEKFGDNNYLGTREKLPDGKFGSYQFKTYAQVQDIATRLGSGFVNLGLTTTSSDYQDLNIDFLIIWAKNREKWLISDIACALYGLSLVPVYDTLGPETVKFIFGQTKAISILVSTEHLNAIIDNAKHCPTLKNVVYFDSASEEQKTKAEAAGLKLMSYDDVLKSGENKRDYKQISPQDIYTVNYTSGTTGLPKGVVISQQNQVAAAAGIANRQDITIGPDDVYISYLPLAHTLERTASLLLAMKGATIGFYNGDVQRITSDLHELKPTIFVSVPRLFTRFYEKMQEGLDKLTGVKKTLATKAVEAKLDNLKKYGALQHNIYDTLVFEKMRQAMGGRVRFMLTGSAPIEPRVQDFLRIALGVPLVEGYGQTESCASSFISHIEVPSFGHVGGPLNCVEFKVVDVPEMNYTSKDTDSNGALCPRGEVCLRGPSIFRGYYKDPEKTAETIDKDGWVHTGDIGRINPDGSLSIIDRKKNIFKLAQGEYVASEKVENVYLTSKYIAEAFLYGDSLKSHTIVIAVPNKETLLELGKELNLQNLSYEELCANKQIKEKVLADMNKRGRESKINSFELAKQIHLEPESFGTKDLLTPTFKLMRHQAKNYYKKIIDQLYELPIEVKKN